MRLRALRDYIIITSDPPGVIGGVVLPQAYNWIQASGTVVASNCTWIEPGMRVRITPGSGERFPFEGAWYRRVEVWDVLAYESGV